MPVWSVSGSLVVVVVFFSVGSLRFKQQQEADSLKIRSANLWLLPFFIIWSQLWVRHVHCSVLVDLHSHSGYAHWAPLYIPKHKEHHSLCVSWHLSPWEGFKQFLWRSQEIQLICLRFNQTVCFDWTGKREEPPAADPGGSGGGEGHHAGQPE